MSELLAKQYGPQGLGVGTSVFRATTKSAQRLKEKLVWLYILEGLGLLGVTSTIAGMKYPTSAWWRSIGK